MSNHNPLLKHDSEKTQPKGIPNIFYLSFLSRHRPASPPSDPEWDPETNVPPLLPKEGQPQPLCSELQKSFKKNGHFHFQDICTT